MMLSNKTKENLSKAAIAGTVLAVSTSLVYGNGATDFAGMSIPAAVPIFIAGAGGSLVTDAVSSQLRLPTTSSQKIADVSSLAIASAISAVGAVTILKVSVGLPNETIPRIAAFALASQASADYITHRYLEDQKGMFIF
jgi:hypothetical protein